MFRHKALAVAALLAWVGLLLAQEDGAAPEDLSAWSHYHEIELPDKPGKYLDVVLTPGVFGVARPDLADLRLVDADGKAIPYALRVKTPTDETRDVPARSFDAGKNADHSAQLSLDLGDNPPEYDRVVVEVPGECVSRRLRVEGSADAKQWVTILDKARLVSMSLDAGQRIEQRSFGVPPSRQRYLRVRVWPDEANAQDRPEIRSATATRRVQVPGETVTLPAALGERKPVRQYGNPASAWEIDLGANNVPASSLLMTVRGGDFTRPYELRGESNEIMSVQGGGMKMPDGGNPDGRVEGVAQTREGTRVSFPEMQTRKLKLIVTDSRNAPLRIEDVRYSAAARTVIFSVPAGTKGPLRLYSGNPGAGSPNYDFATRLPAKVEPLARVSLGETTTNPDYVPPPKAWTERWPYAADAVLLVACGVLGALLLLLARAAIRRRDAAVGQASA